MYYKLLPFQDEEDKIILPKGFCHENSLSNEEIITIRAGVKEKTVKIIVAVEEKEEDSIMLSNPVISWLSLPLEYSYQVVVKDNILNVGPIIGLLFAKEHSKFTKIQLVRYLKYSFYYPRFKGLLCLFSFEDVDFENSRVTGYCYKDKENSWEKEVFPLPQVIYRRTFLKASQKEKLKAAIGDMLFNSKYFSKWYLWKELSPLKHLRKHMPYTCLLNSLEDVDSMLKEYGTIYLKPAIGSKAEGLIQVKKDESYYFQEREKDYPIVIEKREAAINYIERLKKEKKYIVQQAVHSLKIEERMVDFRVIMQKDETLKWSCTAIMSKVGKVNGICSNFREFGYALSFEKALERTTALSEKEIIDKREELIQVCLMVCKELDNKGENFGDFAIDVSIDESLNIWILEVNKEQDFSVLLSLYDRDKYISIKANPTRYALGLTEFSIFD